MATGHLLRKSATWEPRRQYIYGGSYIDEPLIFDKDTNGDGVCDDLRYFYCRQLNYNIVALTDADGTTVEKIKYDPYGEATVWSQTEDTDNPYLFQGRRYDAETGLYYFRNRYYSSTLGRFLQRDAAGYQDGMSLYEFEGNSPVVSLDPAGLKEKSAFRQFVEDALEKIAEHIANKITGWLLDKAIETFEELNEKDKETIRQVGCALVLYNTYKDAQPPRGYSGKPDAYKHCLLSCMIARHCSEDTAVGVGLAKELADKVGKGTAEMRDMMNNHSGWECAEKKDTTCKECCACEETAKY